MLLFGGTKEDFADDWGVLGEAYLTCINPKTGKIIWEKMYKVKNDNGWCRIASPIFDKNELIILYNMIRDTDQVNPEVSLSIK
ncbi:MAG: hypothetical protein R2883_08275 [Caldisericia bacterium]